MKNKRKYVLVLSLLILGLALLASARTQIDPQCTSPDVHQTYLYTLESKYAACTYLQLVTSQLYFVLIFPLFVISPALFVLLIVFGYKAVKKKFTRNDAGILLNTLLVVLVLSLLLSIVYTYGALKQSYR